MQDGDNRQRNHERGRMRGTRGQAQRVEGWFEQVRERRFTDGAEGKGADGDAELGAGQHEREAPHRAQRRARPPRAAIGLQLHGGPTCGDQGELGGHEERVRGQQRDGDRSGGDRVHAGAPSGSPGRSTADGCRVGVSSMRSMRSRSMRSTRTRTSPTTTSSPTSGSRPSRCMISPPTVS